MQQLTPSNPPIIAIIGLGYVGLPLALAFSKHYQVIGYDLNHARVDALKKGEDTTLETDAEAIKNANHLVLTNDLAKIASATVFIVTVPTPVNADKSPDLSSLLYASSQIASLLKRGDIVIYESTVYPGCTEEDCVPVLEKYSALKFNQDFKVGYSPERINPGDKVNTVETIVKVVSGSDAESAENIAKTYELVVKAGTHRASSIKVAEASKIIENTQRDVNIARIGRVALMYQTTDRQVTGAWDNNAREWVELPAGDYRTAIQSAIRVASQLDAPRIIELPVLAPEAAQ